MTSMAKGVVHLNKLPFIVLATMLCTQALPQSSGGLPAINRKTTPTATEDKSAATLASHRSKQQQLYVLGQKISFTNPIGYCTPGDSVREKELIATSKQMLSSSVRLAHVAVRCDELDAYRTGKRETLDHWMQIQLIGLKGEFKRLEIPREAFLAGLAKTTPKLDMGELKSKINSKLNDFDMGVSNLNVHAIGRDGNAYYMSARSTLMYGDKSKVVTGLGGVTLINSLPLGVWIYESTETPNSRDQLHVLLQQAFTSLISEN